LPAEHRTTLRSHISATINPTLWVGWDLRIESLLNLLQHLLILLTTDEADTQSLRTETSGTTDTMEIGVGIGREIVIDGQVDAFDVNATAEDVGRDADALVEFFELFVAFDTSGC
jgi:hypothetical protein